MSWDNITGEEKILPSVGGGGNEVKFENGKPKKIRLILKDGEQPYSYLEHTIENEIIENGKVTNIFRTVRCPKTTNNPNAPCPLCDGQQLKRRARNAANVWDYDLGQVQKLNQGDSVWKPIATTRKLGVDVQSVDWVVLKTGEGRNDTKYSATNIGQSQFVLPQDAVLYDIESEYAPHTEEEMKLIVESCGLVWENVITPPTLTYPPTLQAALDHVMPNGKYKGQTFKQMWDADPSQKGMINFLATRSDRITEEKAAAQVILVNLGGANIPGVPKFGNGGTVVANSQPSTHTTAPTVNTAPKPAPIVGNTAPQTPVVNNVPQAPIGNTDKVNQINALLSSKPKFVKGGFAVIMDALKQASGGKTNIVEFTDAELDKLLEICNAEG